MKRRPVLLLGSCVAALLVAASAPAIVVVDQEQPAIDTTAGAMLIGGVAEQKLAQVFTVGIEGVDVGVQLPVQCQSGTLIVQLTTLAPDGTLLPPGDEGRADASALPLTDPPVFRTILFDFSPAAFRWPVGGRMAIILSNPTGTCSIARSPAGDSYAGGSGMFDARPNPPGWLPLSAFDTPSRDDIPFRTLVDVDPPRRARFCTVNGFGPVPFVPDFAPVCRCLADESLREQRCGLFHPSFFMFRRMPELIRPGEKFEVLWTLVALGPIKGFVELTEALPPGFQSSLKGPLVFHAEQLGPGSSMTLSYQGVAGNKSGVFRVPSVIAVSVAGRPPDDGTMQTFWEVVRPK